MADSTCSYEVDTPTGMVRLLLSDIAEPWVFTDAEVDALIALEGGSVKLAAAQAIDTNATNQALASKVLRTQDVTTDGAKLADAMRKHADALRAQYAREVDAAAEDDFYFGVVSLESHGGPWPELTQRPYC